MNAGRWISPVRALPSQQLIDLLRQLKLASPADVRAAHGHARRLAKDLPLFDSVWLDALVQTRRLTLFQTAAINAGRGPQLRVGPYVLVAPCPRTSLGRRYRARQIDSHRDVLLTVVACDDQPGATIATLDELARKTAALKTPHAIPIERSGFDAERLWVASRWPAGRTAAEWLVQGGRIPPDVVLEIARQMAAGLAVCEASAIVHGDISAQQLVLDPLGIGRLLEPGLRTIVRPSEVESSGDSLPEMFDYLAPQRLRDVAPASMASDIYACGVLWWHLLAGRSPWAGATASARRGAMLSMRIRPIHPIAPDTPRALAAAIAACTEPEVEKRPPGFAALLAMLGPPSDRGQALVARHLARGVSPPERLLRRVHTMRRSPHMPTWAAAAGGVALALVVACWSLWQSWPTLDRRAGRDAVGLGASSPREATAQATPRPVSLPSALPRPAPAHIARPAAKHSDVALATAVVPVPLRDVKRTMSPEFVISAVRPVAWSSVRPAPGQTVRGRSGERPRIVLPPEGATLAVENVRFDGIDFVAPRVATSAAALVTVNAYSAKFHRCSFQAADSAPAAAALHWSPAVDARSEASSPPPEFELRQCAIARVGAGIRCGISRPAALSLSDVLFLGTGPLVSITDSRQWATDVSMRHCTVRGAECVIELDTRRGGPSAGEVSVYAEACVFALDKAGAVVKVTGREAPANALRLLEWQGEGCVIAPQMAIAQRDRGDGLRYSLAKEHFAIQGLVRTEMGFAGDPEDGPDACRLVRGRCRCARRSRQESATHRSTCRDCSVSGEEASP